MFITTQGIVLRTYPFRDKKLIAKIFTRDCGLISCIIKKDPSQIMLSELLTIAEITYKKSRNQNMFYLKEVRVEYVYRSLTRNPKKIRCAIMLCEILTKCLTEKNIEVYLFIINSFKFLDQQKDTWTGFESLFLIKICHVWGIQPLMDDRMSKEDTFVLNIESGVFEVFFGQKEDVVVPPKESLEIYNLSKIPFESLASYSITENLNTRILNYLILYISGHLSDLSSLKSLKILKQLI